MNIIPTPAEFIKEGLLVAGGLLIAALILRQFPALRAYVTGASISVKDATGKELL